MVTVKIDIKPVQELLQKQFDTLSNREYLLRPVAFDMVDLMRKRIHIDGKAADGAAIGSYSSEYLKLREKKYNRSADKKIIVSLTRQLENDWAVLATPNGYGIGFNNPFNYNKARWVEENKDKAIFSLSSSEYEQALDEINDLVSKALELQ